jgi:DNA polymerase-3 subunit alpha
MSKKKADVMERERVIFVHGDEKQGVAGCIANGIDEKTANKIFDEMIDFAKYAFNKSHAAAYAVVSYQTAYLKYYYPVEFMAALMTSVMDHPQKVAEYIYACRQMNIAILPPDINCGISEFSVDDGNIRYGLAAIKGIGRPVIEAIVQERILNGTYASLEDFVTRMYGKQNVNKRVLENLIKAGALDCLFGEDGTRKNFLCVYLQVMDRVQMERKSSMAGQMTLFDFVGVEERKEFEIHLPKVGEFPKEELLAYEKEVLGIYISGHPLEAYEERWKRAISATTLDFYPDEETNQPKVQDEQREIIGGMIIDKVIKYTRTNQVMAFLTIEDLLGTVEVIVFPRVYELYREYLEVDTKVLIRGRVSVEDDKPSKLICEKIVPFDRQQKELWLEFADKEQFQQEEMQLYRTLLAYKGEDPVMIFCRKERAIKRLPKHQSVKIDEQLLGKCMNLYGEKRVKVVEKVIENHL